MAFSFINLTQKNPKQDAAMQRKVRIEAQRLLKRKTAGEPEHAAKARPTTCLLPTVSHGTNRALPSSRDLEIDTVNAGSGLNSCDSTGWGTLNGNYMLIHDEDDEPDEDNGPDEDDEPEDHGMFDTRVGMLATSSCSRSNLPEASYLSYMSMSETDRLINAYVQLSGDRPRIEDFFNIDGDFVSSACLHAINYKSRALRYTRVTDMLRAHAFRYLKKRLESKETASSDQTIRFLCSLLAFEMVEPSVEVLVHFQGMKNLVALRGDISRLGWDGSMQVHATYLDLHAAVTSNWQPFLSSLDEPGVQSAPDLMYDTINPKLISTARLWNPSCNFVLFTPLLRFQGSSKALLPFLSRHMADTLEATLCLTEHFFSSEGPRVLCSLCLESVTATLAEADSNIPQPPSTTTSLEYACQLATVIYTRAIVDSIAFKNSINLEYGKALRQALHGISSDMTARLPFLVLWLMLVSVATTSVPAAGRYSNRILRTTAYTAFNNMRKVLSNFIWIQKRLRGEPWPFDADYKQKKALMLMITRRRMERAALRVQQSAMGSWKNWETSFALPFESAEQTYSINMPT